MKIIDLFSGVGGLTFGFYYNLIDGKFVKRKDTEFVLANEYAPNAVAAFRENYPDINMIEGDIREVLSDDVLDEYMKGGEVDVIIGGPPCQSFSTVGQRKYAERAKLSNEYLRILEKVKPKMFLFENVKGILSMRETFYKRDEETGEYIYEDVEHHRGDRKFTKKELVKERTGELVIKKLEEEFKRIGYTIKYETKCAVDFGVPQIRERVFIIGIRNDVEKEWIFPEGDGERLTIKDAIDDLPECGENQHIKTYDKDPITEYQKLMRRDCRESAQNFYCQELTQHLCGVYGDKIRTVIEHVQQGQGKDDFNALVDAGIVEEKYRLTSGFPNTYGRLKENEPCTTITNNLATPSGLRCIHYRQHRALTPREGARIQSFPDWFQFNGNRTDVARQVGNAVPPLMAIAFANRIIDTLEK